MFILNNLNKYKNIVVNRVFEILLFWDNYYWYFDEYFFVFFLYLKYIYIYVFFLYNFSI